MPNVLISELDQATSLASTTIVMVQQAAGPPAQYANMGQVAAFTLATTVALTGQSTATIAVAGIAALPTGPVGFLAVSINGAAFKIPYYT